MCSVLTDRVLPPVLLPQSQWVGVSESVVAASLAPPPGYPACLPRFCTLFRCSGNIASGAEREHHSLPHITRRSWCCPWRPRGYRTPALSSGSGGDGAAPVTGTGCLTYSTLTRHPGYSLHSLVPLIITLIQASYTATSFVKRKHLVQP